jgi:prepilin-type N-terminal cleavage/methylation domain-containing protein
MRGKRKTHVIQARGLPAFTLIELLVVIAIVGLLSSVVFASLNSARAKARDAQRLASVREIQKALEMYYADFGRYPDPGSDDCAGWDVGNQERELLTRRGMEQYFAGGRVPRDPTARGNCNGFRYYRYPAGSYGCPESRGAYYVLQITDLETRDRPAPESPGWRCTNRNWQDEADWVTGSFER